MGPLTPDQTIRTNWKMFPPTAHVAIIRNNSGIARFRRHCAILRMPVQLAHRTGMNDDEGRRDSRGDEELFRIGDVSLAFGRAEIGLVRAI